MQHCVLWWTDGLTVLAGIEIVAIRLEQALYGMLMIYGYLKQEILEKTMGGFH